MFDDGIAVCTLCSCVTHRAVGRAWKQWASLGGGRRFASLLGSSLGLHLKVHSEVHRRTCMFPSRKMSGEAREQPMRRHGRLRLNRETRERRASRESRRADRLLTVPCQESTAISHANMPQLRSSRRWVPRGTRPQGRLSKSSRTSPPALARPYTSIPVSEGRSVGRTQLIRANSESSLSHCWTVGNHEATGSAVAHLDIEKVRTWLLT